MVQYKSVRWNIFLLFYIVSKTVCDIGINLMILPINSDIISTLCCFIAKHIQIPWKHPMFVAFQLHRYSNCPGGSLRHRTWPRSDDLRVAVIASSTASPDLALGTWEKCWKNKKESKKMAQNFRKLQNCENVEMIPRMETIGNLRSKSEEVA